jgi:N-acetylglutamate synthase
MHHVDTDGDDRLRTQLRELLGRRVALRHRVHGGLLTDAVGELGNDGDGALVVHTRRGPVPVAWDAVVAVRKIPPPTPRRASWAAVARLEHLCADAWPAPVDRPLGAWRLRAAGGFTGRANAALALGDPGLPVADALDAVRAFAAEHGIGPRVHAPIGSRWDRAVTAAGWVLESGHEAGAEVAVLVVDLDRLTRAADDVQLADRPSAQWWALALGREPTPDERFVLDPREGVPTAFGTVPGIGAIRAAHVVDHLHLSRLTVRPDGRRAGVATRLTAAAARWGRERGARWGVLQVALHNTAARALYEGVGAVEHHRFRYLVPPPVTDGGQR